ncbi:MAG: RNA polymerase sigma-70 factor [Rikenellaceae bacterium]|nr:RNA polymerase sigma-70 factor [Rikenellaceae bacterium]MCL2692749.1 RNA polymerase sigma-70 factor [Rikenellaceae bacterium]
MRKRTNDKFGLLSDSFESLFFTYAKGLVAYAVEYLHSKEDAEDIVHDCFVNLWEKIDNIDPEKVRGYLFNATRNMCINHLSHRKVRSQYQEKIIAGDISPAKDNTDFYVESELRRILDEAIAAMPPQRRQVFIKSRLEGKSADDIAAEMNIARRTVDKHIQISSKEIKEYIIKYMYALIVSGII